MKNCMKNYTMEKENEMKKYLNKLKKDSKFS